MEPALDRRRLVLVSNRVPTAGIGGAAGGLVGALRAALSNSEAMWFGWSGAEGDGRSVRQQEAGALRLATVDLPAADIRDYYDGFCNQTLWPVLHGLTHRANVSAEQLERWHAVNRRFARALAPLLRRDDLVWVHDYHLIPLGTELRALGWDGLVGYFHHVPVPTPDGWAQLPEPDRIAGLFAGYDLAGLQTPADAERLSAILGTPQPAVAAHPVSIDPLTVRAEANRRPDDSFRRVRRGRRVVFGVDRLDYTKGIPLRFAAFERLLERRPRWRHEAVFVQWAAPSRVNIDEYRRERQRIEQSAARLNRRFTNPPPVELDCAAHPFGAVAAALRDADVCLVTSLADGMNLVAKEFVAAQPLDDPGVLILSDTCGASVELQSALQVPATNLTAIERALQRALTMPLDERRARWRAMRRAVDTHTASEWLTNYLADLDRLARTRVRSSPARSTDLVPYVAPPDSGSSAQEAARHSWPMPSPARR